MQHGSAVQISIQTEVCQWTSVKSVWHCELLSVKQLPLWALWLTPHNSKHDDIDCGCQYSSASLTEHRFWCWEVEQFTRIMTHWEFVSFKETDELLLSKKWYVCQVNIKVPNNPGQWWINFCSYIFAYSSYILFLNNVFKLKASQCVFTSILSWQIELCDIKKQS